MEPYRPPPSKTSPSPHPPPAPCPASTAALRTATASLEMPMPATATNFVATNTVFRQAAEVPDRLSAPLPVSPASSAPEVADCVGVFEGQFDFIHRTLRRQG